MDKLDTTVFLHRIEKLERQLRLMKLAGITLLFGSLALIIFSGAASNVATARKTIEAEEFRVMDKNGKCRGTLSEHGLRLFDGNEKIYGFFGSPSGVPNLTLYNENGTFRAYIGGVVKGAPEFSLCDGNGNSRVFLYITEKGESCISFLNEGGDIIKEIK